MNKNSQYKRRQRSFQFNRKRIIAGYLFILPFIIGFIALFLVPMIQSFIFSISDIRIKTGGYELISRGFAHYIRALTIDADFRKDLASSFTQLAFNLPTIIIFSFFAATLLNKRFRGRGIARTIFFLPVILASGVIAA
ncbi:MAG: carbohydrate ABC transporter permease, partial [Saccharofermentanales bacterium]